MAVEIVILSGARQGERLLLEAGEFRAGDDPACEVFFDPQNDPSARDRGALFRLAEDGWSVERTGAGQLYVNQEPVVGETRIRSGDLVRMSERGPDFSFGIVTRTTASSRDTSRSAPAPLPSAADATVSELEAELPPGPVPAPRAEPSPQPAPTLPPASATQPAFGPQSVAAAEPWRHAFWAVVGLAVCVLLLVPISLLTVFGLIGPNRQPTPFPEPAVPPAVQPSPEPAEPDLQPEQAGPEREKRDEPAKEPTDVWGEVGEQMRDAVYLIQVEVGSGSGKHFLPFATCCAIGEDTLLVSARETCYLMKWRKQDGYKIWATNPAKEIREEVRDIRVHRDFAKVATEESGDWILVNLGLMTVEGKLPKILPLASSEELSELSVGLDVACFGFAFEEVDKILDTLEPRLTRGKVYEPSLFQLKAKIPPNACGNAIVNAQGKILGVYGNPAPEGTPVRDLHYATVVDPGAINAWLERRDTEIWVDPPIPETPSGP
ncbi:MAG TPA: hypothetical protein VMY37_22430 [Thermoguttaceae bacterium]|nr:hypothetical protein [Thermoguttaceae bacterium]